MNIAIVVAAGRSERFGRDKLRLPLAGKPVWRWSVDTFLRHPLVDAVGIVGPAEFALPGVAFRVEGGSSRQESVRAGLVAAADIDPEALALIHDGARPFVSAPLIGRVIEAARDAGAAAPVLSIVDTVRELPSERVVPRETLLATQTPQAAYVRDLLRAHQRGDTGATDDIALLASIGIRAALVDGDRANFKITTEEDYEMAKALTAETRTGIGYDVHAFSSDPARRLMLGGIEFFGESGLAGHSDADALLHAIVDALLGAAGLGDIGEHFPPSDPAWKNASSLVFLAKAGTLIEKEGWSVTHLDATVLAERPRILGRREEIRRSIASTLGIDPERISIKATTHEGLGAIGRGEGIAAMAVATLSRRGD